MNDDDEHESQKRKPGEDVILAGKTARINRVV